MPNINVSLTDEDHALLDRIKGVLSWKNFLWKASWFLARVNAKPRTHWGEEWQMDKPVAITKPCHTWGACPYGQLVEAFHIEPGPYSVYSCKTFGHDCPAFYCAEPIGEPGAKRVTETGEVPEPTPPEE